MNKRLLIHVPVGILNAYFYPELSGLGFTIAFLGYEYIQEWRKQDNSHKDVIGWLYGLGLGLLLFQ